jgi:hypothetical protein
MKQNTRQDQKAKEGDNDRGLFVKAFENLSKKQIKKKQRRFFKEEKGESLLSKLSKSSSLMVKQSRRRKPLRWSENETNTFYKCLEFFGKDFEMITSVFHNKRKRQIIRKFHKERKRYPERVTLSLQKHESNQIQKTYKECSFFENFFERTDTSEDEMSFIQPDQVFGKQNINSKTPNTINDGNDIILEGLNKEEEGFERQIDLANDQTHGLKVNQKNSLNELLFKINTDGFPNKESIEDSQKFFPCTTNNINNINPQNQVNQNGLFPIKNEFWVSNRIEEEVSEKPPPADSKMKNDKNGEMFSFLISNQNFKEFDLQLKKQSNFDIKPLDFYIKEEEDEDIDIFK